MSRLFGSGYVNRIRYISGAGKGTLVGKNLPGDIKGLLTGNFNVSQLIPEELVNEVAKEFSRTGRTGGAANLERNGLTLAGDNISGNIFNAGKDNTKAARQIASVVNRLSLTHYAYYVGLLRAMNGLVHNPGIPVQEKTYTKEGETITSVVKDAHFDKTVTLHPDISIKAPMNPIRLSGTWPGLTDFTLKDKNRIGSKTFWKHTGEGARAFNKAVTARLAMIKPADFVSSDRSEVRIGAQTSAKQGIGKFYTKVQYKLKLGIPDWNPQMDALITIPFATGRMPSAMTASGLIQFDEEGTERPGFKTSGKKLTGIDRLIAAEAYRPWLRRLSSEAGKQMLAFISGKQVSAGSLPVAQTKRKQALKAQATLKSVAKAKRDAELKANKLQRDTEAFQRHLNNTGTKIISAHKRRLTDIKENVDNVKAVNAKVQAVKAQKQSIKEMPVSDRAARLKNIATAARKTTQTRKEGTAKGAKALDEILPKQAKRTKPTATPKTAKPATGIKPPRAPKAVDQQKMIDKAIKDTGTQIKTLIAEGKIAEAKKLAKVHFKDDRDAHQAFLDRLPVMEKKNNDK